MRRGRAPHSACPCPASRPLSSPALRQLADLLILLGQAIDADSDGMIVKGELKHVFATLMGYEPTAVEVEELMREADVDGDGRISQLDFVNILS